VNILNGLTKAEDSRAFSIPGLVYVPVLRKSLFGTGNTEKDLLIAVTPTVLQPPLWVIKSQCRPRHEHLANSGATRYRIG
jgi:hypothetical protein